jgi:hypothetical protein
VIKEKFIELTEAGANGDAKWIEVMKIGAETCHNKCKELGVLLIGHGGFLGRIIDGVFLGIPGILILTHFHRKLTLIHTYREKIIFDSLSEPKLSIFDQNF